MSYFDLQNCEVEFLSHPLRNLGEGSCFIYIPMESTQSTSYK